MKTYQCYVCKITPSFFLFSCFLFQIPDVFAQAGQNDASFNVLDNRYHFKSANTTLLKLPDGKILATNDYGNVIRLNSNGSLDNTFDGGLGGNIQINDAVLLSDGKILVGGSFSEYNAQEKPVLVRLNSDGSLDNSFQSAFLTSDYADVLTLALQSDGKILVGGKFSTCNGQSRNSLVRLNGDGSLDNSFSIGTGFIGGSNETDDILLQSDGKIIVVGAFNTYNGVSRNGIARLNTDGSLDNTFDVGTGFSGYTGYGFPRIFSVVLQSDGKLIVGGGFLSFNGNNQSFLVRLNDDGSLDNSFNTGTGLDDVVHQIALQSDEKVIISGIFNTVNGNSRNGIARLNSNGSLDNTFDVGTGLVGGNYVYPFSNYTSALEIVVESDGKILLGGSFDQYNGTNTSKIVRINVDGSFDNTFLQGTGFNGSINTLVLQPDGKILVGGFVSSFNQNSLSYIIRLNSDGTTDNTFQAFIPFRGYGVYDIALQADGKIIVAGNLYDYQTDEYNYITRLNADGTIDNTFQVTGFGFNGSITALQHLPSGKTLVGGVFYFYDMIVVASIARINIDGSLDTSFNVGGSGLFYFGFPEVRDFEVQADGKILMGGYFYEYNDRESNHITRMHSNGSVDTTFRTTGANDVVYGIALQADGKMIIGGAFSQCGDISRNGIARLNSDGSLDNTFNVGTGFMGGVYTTVFDVQLQADGKVIVVGDFTSYNGIPVKNICRLNIDGSLDSSFDAGTSTDERIFTALIQPNDKILIGGFFGKYNGAIRNSLARLENCVGRITPKALNPIIQGTPYTQVFTQTGISGNITWQIVSGNLPEGLSLDASTGIISGTPLLAQTVNFTIQVSNGTCFSREVYQISIPKCPVTILPDSLTLGTVGNSYSQTLTQTGITGNVTWQITSGNLPQGLSLNTNTGEITGVPIVSDSTEFEITVLGGICLEKKKYQIKVLNTFNSCDITVYPNPTNQDLKIAFNNTYQGNYQIKLFDLLGREIFIKNFIIKQERELAIFNIQGLSKGVYILEIKGESCEKLLKVVKLDN